MKRLSIAILLALTAACASGGATTGSGASSPADKRNTISAEEIAKARSPGWFAYELINALRPSFLKPKNAVTLESRDPIYADVYLNDVYHGDIDSLKSLNIEGITSIQYLSPFDAATRFGKEMPGGAIMIRNH